MTAVCAGAMPYRRGVPATARIQGCQAKERSHSCYNVDPRAQKLSSLYPESHVGCGWVIINGERGAVRLPKILVLMRVADHGYHR